MAGQNDFLIFDENKDNMLTQELYQEDTDRTDGFQKGVARSNVNNKVLHQTSMMCHAIGELAKDNDFFVSDEGSVDELKSAIGSLFSASDKVSKTGDTMTGTLNLTGMTDDTCQQRIVANDYGVMFRNDGENFYMLLTNAGDAFGHWNDFRPFTMNFAGGYITTGTPTVSDNSSKLATTNFVKSVLSSSGNGLATVKKSANGYIKFNNGIIMQWGNVAGFSGEKTITLPVAFSTKNYSVVAGVHQVKGDYTANWATYTYTTTTFILQNQSSGAKPYTWLAIGY